MLPYIPPETPGRYRIHTSLPFHPELGIPLAARRIERRKHIFRRERQRLNLVQTRVIVSLVHTSIRLLPLPCPCAVNALQFGHYFVHHTGKTACKTEIDLVDIFTSAVEPIGKKHLGQFVLEALHHHRIRYPVSRHANRPGQIVQIISPAEHLRPVTYFKSYGRRSLHFQYQCFLTHECMTDIPAHHRAPCRRPAERQILTSILYQCYNIHILYFFFDYFHREKLPYPYFIHTNIIIIKEI